MDITGHLTEWLTGIVVLTLLPFAWRWAATKGVDFVVDKLLSLAIARLSTSGKSREQIIAYIEKLDEIIERIDKEIDEKVLDLKKEGENEKNQDPKPKADQGKDGQAQKDRD